MELLDETALRLPSVGKSDMSNCGCPPLSTQDEKPLQHLIKNEFYCSMHDTKTWVSAEYWEGRRNWIGTEKEEKISHKPYSLFMNSDWYLFACPERLWMGKIPRCPPMLPNRPRLGDWEPLRDWGCDEGWEVGNPRCCKDKLFTAVEWQNF